MPVKVLIICRVPITVDAVTVKCSLCSKIVLKHSWKTHVLFTHTQRPFSCNICGKSYRRKEALISHELMHTKADLVEYKYSCEKCNHRFKEIVTLKNHQKVHDLPSFECNICHKKLTYRHSLAKHLRGHLEKKRNVCDICGKGFPLLDLYREHMKKEHKMAKFTCSICDRTFSEKRSFTCHMTTHNDESKCKICNKKYARLKEHMEKVHNENRRKFICDLCGKEISTLGSLKDHKKSVHLGAKSIACNQCGKRFAKKISLTVHLRTHTGEKPHVCNICGKRFSQRSPLVIHLRTHTGEKPYDCTLCEQKFVSKSARNTHLKTKHKTL